jgi:hypothetical protein
MILSNFQQYCEPNRALKNKIMESEIQYHSNNSDTNIHTNIYQHTHKYKN